MRILLVEDDVPVRRVLMRALTAHGHSVVETGSASSANAWIRNQAFEALVVDINLPEVTGWDVIQHREGTPNGSTAVVVMSAVPPSAARLREFRPLGVLQKPFPMEALHYLVRRAEAAGAVAAAEQG